VSLTDSLTMLRRFHLLLSVLMPAGHLFVIELRMFVEYVTNNLDGLMDCARHNLFTRTYPADLVNLVHVAFNNFVHDQLMNPGTVVPVPRFAAEFMKQVKGRQPDWQKLLPSRITSALQPAIDTSGMVFPAQAPRLSDLETIATFQSTLSSLTGFPAVPHSAPAPAPSPAQQGQAAVNDKSAAVSTRVVNHSPNPAFAEFAKLTGFTIRSVVDNFVNSTDRGGLGNTRSALPHTDDKRELCLAFQICAQCNSTCKRQDTHRKLTPPEVQRATAWCTDYFKNPGNS
jgi:hypothetical protein